VKRAFRLQIARYHPDKVQHLGQEFQAMAADRAAELTEAYRILSDDGRRGEYDRARGASAPAASPGTTKTPDASPAPGAGVVPPPPDLEPGTASEPQFQKERASRDEFVRKATINRLRNAIEAVDAGYDELEVRGFDIAWAPKSKLFGRGKGPRLLGRFVTRVDRDAVVDAWTQAGKTGGSGNDEMCVLLMGSAVAPAGELALAIAEQRRRQRGVKLTLIPVDARNWDAHMPVDAPGIAKTLLARLRTGS
jgi:curved DNA-binding protein CbpA